MRPKAQLENPADARLHKYRDAEVDFLIAESDEVTQFEAALEKLSQTRRKKSSELHALLGLTQRINSGLALDQLLDRVFASFKSIIPYDRIGLALIEPDGRTARQQWVRSASPSIRIQAGFSASLEQGSSLQEVLRTRRPRIISDLKVYLREHPDSDSARLIVEEGIRSSLTCPLVEPAGPSGFLFFSSLKPNVYNDINAELFLQIAGQVSSIVEKGRLHQTVLELNQELLRRTAEQQTLNAAVAQLVNEDPLTGLLNRRAFSEVLRKAVSLARRTPSPLSLVMLDLDYFKEVNDRYGHLVGDRLLVATAQLLTRCCREEDSVSRFGGEEFLVLLPNTSLEDAVSFCERVRLAMFHAASSLPWRTASFGVTELRQVDTLEAFTDRADRAMYRAKESGRNRICADV